MFQKRSHAMTQTVPFDVDTCIDRHKNEYALLPAR